jgi:hypothetical protein
MEILITMRVADAGDRVVGGSTKGRCQVCGEEVYIAPSSWRLMQERHIMGTICRACFTKCDVSEGEIHPPTEEQLAEILALTMEQRKN